MSEFYPIPIDKVDEIHSIGFETLCKILKGNR